MLLTGGKKLAENQPEPIRNGIKKMNVYLWSLWGVYPVVYIAEALSVNNPNINLDWFNTASALADVINKVGFAITTYLAVKALSGDSQESLERVPKKAVGKA